MQNGRLYVSGLTAGKLWSVYDISGMLIYQNVADSNEANISMSIRGVYIVTSDGRTIKLLF